MRLFSVPGICLALLFGASVAVAEDEPREIAAPRNSAHPALDGGALEANLPTLRALVVTRGDCIVSEYYRPGSRVTEVAPVFSVTKSVLSILVGIAADEGYLRLDERLTDLMPDAFDASVDPLAQTITLRDLLTMTAGFSGQAKPEIPTHDMWRWMLYRPVTYAPGSHFSYDDVAANLLSVALSHAIKQDPVLFAREKLFQPLGVEHYAWPADSEGNLLGGSGLFMTLRDMAKIGVLYLNGGRWGDRQIVSESYVRDSTKEHSEGGAPVRAAYGYLWWVKKAEAGEETFFAAGHLSQLIYVVPKRHVVVAMSAEGIPGGSSRLMDDVVMPAEANLPASAPCIARLGAARIP
jgi:CubicO group peptidase (beta-lactamase class C family)